MYVNFDMLQMCLWSGYYEVNYNQFRFDFYPTYYEDNKAGFFANI